MTSSVLVIGKTGQIAMALARCASVGDHEIICAGRPELDLLQPGTLNSAFTKIKPAIVVNAAAYTQVDKAEDEPDQAYAINCVGSELLAKLCKSSNIPLIHLSTDYVFSGNGLTPVAEDNPIAPIGVYGQTKAQGEAAIRGVLDRYIILRTAWVFSQDGQNFLKTMLRLCSERETVNIVSDQHGTPTYAEDIATAICTIIDRYFQRDTDLPWGTYHLTNSGETTWHGFGLEVFSRAMAAGGKAPRINPVSTADFPTKARRPAYAVLDTQKIKNQFNISLPAWQDGVRRCMAKLL